MADCALDFVLFGHLWFLVALLRVVASIHLGLLITCIGLILAFYLSVDTFGCVVDWIALYDFEFALFVLGGCLDLELITAGCLSLDFYD